MAGLSGFVDFCLAKFQECIYEFNTFVSDEIFAVFNR